MPCGTCSRPKSDPDGWSLDPCLGCNTGDTPALAQERLRLWKLLVNTLETLRNQAPPDVTVRLVQPGPPPWPPSGSPTRLCIEIDLPAQYGIQAYSSQQGPSIGIWRPRLRCALPTDGHPILRRVSDWLLATLGRRLLAPRPNGSSS